MKISNILLFFIAPNSAAGQAKYAPGEIIVKFTPQMAEKVYQAFNNGSSTRFNSNGNSIDKLNAKHKIKSLKRVFCEVELKNEQGKVIKILSGRELARKVNNKFK